MKKLPAKVKLSIIILNYNTEALLRQCLASIPSRPDYQVIVIDNASTDNSVIMVQKEFPEVELIKNKENCGFTRGNNCAREKAKGEYVLFLNSDTQVYPGTLERMVQFMDYTLDAGISTCLTLLPNGGQYYASHRGFPTPWNSLAYFTGLAKLFPKSKMFSGYTATYLPLDKVHEVDAVSGTFLLIRKKLLDKIGWFDEDYFSYGEDIEMCYRVKELGYKVYFVPDVKIMHYWGASSGLKSTSKSVAKVDPDNQARWNQARYDAMRIFYDKHYRKKYPELFRSAVLGGIGLVNYLRRGRD
ncbi:glycosyltransferase family 2 protein [Patescibacteria group bacterium]|nr:glycosyltransferase family 2 protein [Patescibacteria group bacterium]